MNTWCIHGWRHQSTDREQLLAWISEAKQLGFERYNLFRQGEHYWLCCGVTERFDIAAAVRSHISESAAVVVQQQGQQFVVVAWQRDTLLGCCEFTADKHGVQSFLLTAEHWLNPQQMNCVFIIAGADTQRLLADCSEAKNARLVTALPLERYKKTAQMRSLRRSPPWLRQRILLRGLVATAVMVATSTWWFWPEPPAVIEAPVIVEQPQPPVIKGWQAQHIRHVSALLSHVSFLAGWQVVRWQLSETEELLWVQQTYGSKADLLLQLPSQDWQFKPSSQGLQLTRSPSTTEVHPEVEHQSKTPLANDVQITAAQINDRLVNAGFRLSAEHNHLEIQHPMFDPISPEQWQALMDWLATKPDAVITAMSAQPEYLTWRLSITVHQP